VETQIRLSLSFARWNVRPFVALVKFNCDLETAQGFYLSRKLSTGRNSGLTETSAECFCWDIASKRVASFWRTAKIVATHRYNIIRYRPPTPWWKISLKIIGFLQNFRRRTEFLSRMVKTTSTITCPWKKTVSFLLTVHCEACLLRQQSAWVLCLLCLVYKCRARVSGRLSLNEYLATNMSRDSQNVELRRQNRLSTLQWFIRSHFENPSSCLIRCGQLYAPDRTKDNTEWCSSAREKLPDNVICSARKPILQLREQGRWRWWRQFTATWSRRMQPTQHQRLFLSNIFDTASNV